MCLRKYKQRKDWKWITDILLLLKLICSYLIAKLPKSLWWENCHCKARRYEMWVPFSWITWRAMLLYISRENSLQKRTRWLSKVPLWLQVWPSFLFYQNRQPLKKDTKQAHGWVEPQIYIHQYFSSRSGWVSETTLNVLVYPYLWLYLLTWSYGVVANSSKLWQTLIIRNGPREFTFFLFFVFFSW